MERIPILRMGRLLLVTIQVDMHDRLAMTLQDDLTDAHQRRRGARGVLIDISALEIVDSFIGRMISQHRQRWRACSTRETVVVGMQPAVAITLVELGLSLPGVRTALNVEKGMALLQRVDRGGRRPRIGRRRMGSERRACRCSVMRCCRSGRRHDIVTCARRCAPGRSSLGLGLVDQTKIVTAASELARNTLEYGGGGTARLEALQDGPRRACA